MKGTIGVDGINHQGWWEEPLGVGRNSWGLNG